VIFVTFEKDQIVSYVCLLYMTLIF